MTPTNISEQLDRDEGNVPYVYPDHLGYLTIGKGFMVDKRKGGCLFPEEIEFILQNRIRRNDIELTKKIPWFNDLDDARKGVLRNMAYQMGVEGLLGFKNTLKFVMEGNYKQASENMLKSLWAKQTPKRAQRLAKQMETGLWQ
jgi:lysozyme